jgi:integrase/recombinase XerD
VSSSVAARRTRAGAAPTDRSPTLEDALTGYRTYLLNSGRSDGYAESIRFFLGSGNVQERWEPLCQYMQNRGFTRLSHLNQANLNGWLTHMREKQPSQYSYAKAVELMKRWFRYEVSNGEMSVPPIQIQTPRSPEAEIATFSDDEIAALHKVVKTENVRDFAIFMLLCDTGIRANELCSLRVDDVRLERAELVVQGDIAKTKKSRTLTLTESIGPLRRYLSQRPDVPTDKVFLSFCSTPVYAGGQGKKGRMQTGKLPWSQGSLSTGGLRQLVRKWGKLANISEARCSPHTFRHFFALGFLRAGGDVFSLQKILGHSKIEMTMRYVRLVDIDIKQRTQQFSPALRFAKDRYKKA